MSESTIAVQVRNADLTEASAQVGSDESMLVEDVAGAGAEKAAFADAYPQSARDYENGENPRCEIQCYVFTA